MDKTTIARICRELGGIEEPVYRQLLDLFLQQAAGQIDTARSERAASRWPEAARAAHSIKGAAANLRLTELSRGAALLEAAGTTGNAADWDAAFPLVQAEFVALQRDSAGMPP